MKNLEKRISTFDMSQELMRLAGERIAQRQEVSEGYSNCFGGGKSLSSDSQPITNEAIRREYLAIIQRELINPSPEGIKGGYNIVMDCKQGREDLK